MKVFALASLLLAQLAVTGWCDTVIAYAYDQQHRLVAADYSQAQSDARVTYQYDAANNLDLRAAITDGQWLRSFLLWLGRVAPMGHGAQRLPEQHS